MSEEQPSGRPNGSNVRGYFFSPTGGNLYRLFHAGGRFLTFDFVCRRQNSAKHRNIFKNSEDFWVIGFKFADSLQTKTKEKTRNY